MVPRTAQHPPLAGLSHILTECVALYDRQLAAVRQLRGAPISPSEAVLLVRGARARSAAVPPFLSIPGQQPPPTACRSLRSRQTATDAASRQQPCACGARSCSIVVCIPPRPRFRSSPLARALRLYTYSDATSGLRRKRRTPTNTDPRHSGTSTGRGSCFLPTSGIDMAKLLSHPYSIIRGSIGGTTYLAGRTAAIIARQRVSPVQPNTNPRTVIRGSLSQAVAAWESASNSQRLGWAEYARTIVLSGPVGPYQPTGRELAIGQYVASAYLIALDSGTSIAAVSMEAPVDAGQLAAATIITGPPVTGTGFSINIKNINEENVEYYLVGSLAQSLARNYYKGPWITATLQSVDLAEGADDDIEQQTPSSGRKYFIRVRGISVAAPRRMSPEQIITVISADAPI